MNLKKSTDYVVDTLEAALRTLVASGELRREGVGKRTCYFRESL